IDPRANLAAAGAVALEVAMLEIDAGRAAGFGREPDLHFARLRDVRHVLPFAVEHPGEHEPVRRLPDRHQAPWALGAVHRPSVAPAADLPFDDPFVERRFTDMMTPRPPRIESRG